MPSFSPYVNRLENKKSQLHLERSCIQYLYLVISGYRLQSFRLSFSLLKIINKLLLCKKIKGRSRAISLYSYTQYD